MKNFFETTMRVDASRTDLRFNISLAGILELIEDAQTIHTGEMKVDAPSFRKNDGAFWVITRTFLHINRLPVWEENVTVGTYPLKPTAIRSERQNYIADANGNMLITGKNEWCALDCVTRKIRPVNTLKSYPHELEHKTERLYTAFPPVSAPEPDDADFVYERRMRVSDLDFNRHVNNVKYTAFIIDCFPASFWEDKTPSDVRIDYLNECREGETLRMYARARDNVLRFTGRTDDRIIFKSVIILK